MDDIMQQAFPQIVDEDFTATMETLLDGVAGAGKKSHEDIEIGESLGGAAYEADQAVCAGAAAQELG